MNETYRLARPVEAGGRTIAEITLRRPTGKDFRALGDVQQLTRTTVLATMVQNLAGLTTEEFDALDAADVVQLTAIAAGFFAPAAASTPSASKH